MSQLLDYVERVRPYEVNKVLMQKVLWNRILMREVLVSKGLEKYLPKAISLTDRSLKSFVQTDDMLHDYLCQTVFHKEVQHGRGDERIGTCSNGIIYRPPHYISEHYKDPCGIVRKRPSSERLLQMEKLNRIFPKPFVEKPMNADNHSVWVHFGAKSFQTEAATSSDADTEKLWAKYDEEKRLEELRVAEEEARQRLKRRPSRVHRRDGSTGSLPPIQEEESSIRTEAATQRPREPRPRPSFEVELGVRKLHRKVINFPPSLGSKLMASCSARRSVLRIGRL